MSGGAGIDVLWGGSGNDTVQGDAGRDSLWGMSNDDTMLAQDGEADSVHAGTGFDTCELDTIDTASRCKA
jgi:Ca2+-binding RTX toxin-like protein